MSTMSVYPALLEVLRDVYKSFAAQDKTARTAAWHAQNTRRAEAVRVVGDLLNFIIANEDSFVAWMETVRKEATHG